MKTLIFLLLLSGAAWGQGGWHPLPDSLNSKPAHPIAQKVVGKVHIKAQDRSSPVEIQPSKEGPSIRWGTGETVINRGGRICVGHIWVEKHEDTVMVVDNSNVWNDRAHRVPPEYQETINLVCLRCHKEKRKVVRTVKSIIGPHTRRYPLDSLDSEPANVFYSTGFPDLKVKSLEVSSAPTLMKSEEVKRKVVNTVEGIFELPWPIDTPAMGTKLHIRVSPDGSKLEYYTPPDTSIFKSRIVLF